MTKTKHILGLSGGKDSAALAVHMNNRHPDIDVEYFFTDTGYELQETYDFLDKLKTRLDKPIQYIHQTNSFDYYKWRSRSGCTFCFFQKKSEWIGLKENHPKAFEHAKSLEKTADKHDSPFTWIKDMPLTELEKPEMIIKVKEHHAKQLAKLKLNKNKKHQNNPFLKGEDINVEENLALDDVSSSCLICHK